MSKADDLAAKYRKRIEKNLQAGAIFFVGKVKRNLNRTTKYRISGQRRIALKPNKPGNFPRKLTGFLQKSVTWAKLAWWKVQAGTRYLVGKYLELKGYSFIVRTYKENKAELKRIILRK